MRHTAAFNFHYLIQNKSQGSTSTQIHLLFKTKSDAKFPYSPFRRNLNFLHSLMVKKSAACAKKGLSMFTT